MKKYSLLTVLLILAGCVKYHPKPLFPESAIASFESRTLISSELRAFMEKNLQNKAEQWPPDSWDLEMLSLAAFYYSPELDVARAKWGIAKAQVKNAGRRPNPTVTYTPEFDTNPLAGLSPWILGFNLDIPIETAGKRGYRIAQAENLSEAARLNIAGDAWRVRSRLRAALLKLYTAEHQEKILQKQLAVYNDLVGALEHRLEFGEASSPEITQMRILRDQADRDRIDAQKQDIEARAELARVMGVSPDSLKDIVISTSVFDDLPAEAWLPSKEVRRMALQNRADLLAALEEYKASEAALRLEIARQYPDLHLGPGYNWDQGENKWALGLSVTLPVFDRNRGPIAEAEANRSAEDAKFFQLQTQIISDSELALASYKATKENWEKTDYILAEKEKYVQSVETKFKAGEVDRLAYLSAQLEYSSAELVRLAALLSVQKALGLLEDSMQRPLNPAAPPLAAPEEYPRLEGGN